MCELPADAGSGRFPVMPTAHRIDADFARDVLKDLYAYRRRRPALAWMLWGFLGLLGAHRFYLGRPATALLMMFTLGGGLVWWVVDGFLIRRMVWEHNQAQELRRAAGQPPLELAFMPALTDEVLRRPPAWTFAWRARTRRQRWLRFVGDVAVLFIAGVALGALADTDGAEEAIVAIITIIGVTAAGGATGGLAQLPGVRSLIRWNQRLRLFYYFNEPRSPLGLLLRPVTGILLAPFRLRDRAEVRIYLQIGFVFTFGFVILDVWPYVIEPVIREGMGAALGGLFNLWINQAAVTFLVMYAFAAPIGATLTLYLLTRRTHTLPRVLSAFTLLAILLGWSSSG
jgi:TM2 domain-containing membrane protein YozV